MNQKTKIIIDADVIIHFSKGKCEERGLTFRYQPF